MSVRAVSVDSHSRSHTSAEREPFLRIPPDHMRLLCNSVRSLLYARIKTKEAMPGLSGCRV